MDGSGKGEGGKGPTTCWGTFRRNVHYLVILITPLALLPILIMFPGSFGFTTYSISLMCIYWCTACLPLAVTALLPLVLFPLFGVLRSEVVCALYMKDTIVLFMAGFLVAIAATHWNLHKRIVLRVLLLIGWRPRWIMLSLMGTTAFLSMWMSTTATTAMMLPLAHALLTEFKKSTKIKLKEVEKPKEKQVNNLKVEAARIDMTENQDAPSNKTFLAVDANTTEEELPTSYENVDAREGHPDGADNPPEGESPQTQETEFGGSGTTAVELNNEAINHPDETTVNIENDAIASADYNESGTTEPLTVDATEPTENLPEEATQPTENLPIETTQPIENPPEENTQPTEYPPAETTQPTDYPPLEVTEMPENISGEPSYEIDADPNQNTDTDVMASKEPFHDVEATNDIEQIDGNEFPPSEESFPPPPPQMEMADDDAIAVANDTDVVSNLNDNGNAATETGDSNDTKSRGDNEAINMEGIDPETNNLSAAEAKHAEAEADVASPEDEDDPSYTAFCKGLILSVPYAANIGGIATLIGSQHNLLLLDNSTRPFELKTDINFGTYMLYGFPLTLLCLALAWCWLQLYYIDRWFCKRNCLRKGNKKTEDTDKTSKYIRQAYNDMGPMSYAEKVILVHLCLIVLLWLSRDLTFVPGWAYFFKENYITDSTAGMVIALLLFMLPSKPPQFICAFNRRKRKDCYFFHKNTEKPSGNKRIPSLLEWDIVSREMCWSVVVLLGSGFAIAEACKVVYESDSVTHYVDDLLFAIENFSSELIALVVAAVVAAFVEIGSGVSAGAIFVPVLIDLGTKVGVHPMYLVIPAVTSCSFAFMLPTASPSNAIAFAYRHISVFDMVKTGLILNMICIIVSNLCLNTVGRGIWVFDFNSDWDVNLTTVGNSNTFDGTDWDVNLTTVGNSNTFDGTEPGTTSVTEIGTTPVANMSTDIFTMITSINSTDSLSTI